LDLGIHGNGHAGYSPAFEGQNSIQVVARQAGA
jgi:hypothetical protein